MKKVLISLLIVLLVLPSILAITLTVEKNSSNEILVSGLDSPAVFDLEVTNLGFADNFEFYNLVGFDMFPVGTIFISQGQTKNIELKISPIGELDKFGLYTFQYFIRGQDETEQQEKLTFNIIELKDAFEIGSSKIDSNSNKVSIYIKNKVNFDFKDINAKFSSVFFNFEQDFDLAQNEQKEFEVQLIEEDFKKLIAGFYTINAEITVEQEKASVEGVIRLTEKTLVTTTEKNYGFFIDTNVITKTNEGNVLEQTETIIQKNLVSRLFTNFNPEPDVVERSGTKVHYTWAKEIKPGQTIEIIVKTNWLFPLIAIIFIVAIVVITKNYSTTHLNLNKKVSFVRTKGGEFALKISIFVKAKKYVERINIIDKLPALVKIHQRFGGEEPSRIDEKTRRIEWNFEKLEEGEVRVLSYIIYSKMGIMGKFALPSAAAIYEKDGKIKETESNKAFFVSEHKKGEIEDD